MSKVEFQNLYMFSQCGLKRYELGTFSELISDYKKLDNEGYKAIGIEYIDRKSIPCAIDLYNNKGVCKDYLKLDNLKEEKKLLGLVINILDQLIK